MGWWARVTGERPREQLPLYQAIVARAREPHWYMAGGVPDTMDGRFDVIAAVIATVLLRTEREPAGAGPGALLAERFVEDMDGQLREQGIGDIVVGKHVGKMMAMLGGRLGAYRDGWASGDIGPALLRNLYRGNDPGAAAVGHVAGELGAMRDALAALPLATVLDGNLA